MIVASLMAVLLVSSVSTFIIGFVCGQRFGRKLKGPFNQASGLHSSKCPPVPIYESICFQINTHEGQTIELEENVAYGPVTVS